MDTETIVLTRIPNERATGKPHVKDTLTGSLLSLPTCKAIIPSRKPAHPPNITTPIHHLQTSLYNEINKQLQSIKHWVNCSYKSDETGGFVCVPLISNMHLGRKKKSHFTRDTLVEENVFHFSQRTYSSLSVINTSIFISKAPFMQIKSVLRWKNSNNNKHLW